VEKGEEKGGDHISSMVALAGKGLKAQGDN
jgi:hypothetical protein